MDHFYGTPVNYFLHITITFLMYNNLKYVRKYVNFQIYSKQYLMVGGPITADIALWSCNMHSRGSYKQYVKHFWPFLDPHSPFIINHNISANPVIFEYARNSTHIYSKVGNSTNISMPILSKRFSIYLFQILFCQIEKWKKTVFLGFIFFSHSHLKSDFKLDVLNNIF